MGGFFEDPAEKRVYDHHYKKMKEEGYPFHPFATYKDIIAALVLLLILLAFTFIRGVHLDAPADPTSQYLPRPEWYFMWLFQMLKYFPGWTAIFPVAIIPGVIGAALILLPFYDRNPYRHWSKRITATISMTALMGMIVGLTVLAYYEDAKDPHAQQLLAGAAASGHGATGSHGTPPGGTLDGQAIFSANCAMCHGPEGKNIPKVELMSKASLASRDLEGIIRKGTPAGMPPFEGKLKDDEIKVLVKWLNDNAK